MSLNYSTHFNKRVTPQSEAIPGSSQVKNNASGFVYDAGKWAQLHRFLILGSEGGSYYVSEQRLTRENAGCVLACAKEDAQRTVSLIVAISQDGRAPKNDPAIFALAIVASATEGDTLRGRCVQEVRSIALGALPNVCRIPTHLFHFVEYVKGLRGFGRGLRTAITKWYDRWDADQLAFELVKYQSRDGWSNRDVFRQVHPKFSVEKQAVIRWSIGGGRGDRSVKRKNSEVTSNYPATGDYPAIIEAFETLKTVYALDSNSKATISHTTHLIKEYGLTREMLPTEALNNVDVWEALLDKMPITALVRNLNKMTSVGLITPLSNASRLVQSRLHDQTYLQRGRIHPLNVLNAMRVYSAGHGDKGKLTWTPVQPIIDALNEAFYLSFGNVEPTNKNFLLALDISGSMAAKTSGTNLSCLEANAAMALIIANTEKNHHVVGFTSGGFRSGSSKNMWGGQSSITELEIYPRMRLDKVCSYMSSLPMGGTDCALPMLYAQERKLDVDCFYVGTDNETWAGSIHPSQALKQYRSKLGKPDSKSVVVAMQASQFSIADPNDPGMLDVVGFDTVTPQAISAFVRGS